MTQRDFFVAGSKCVAMIVFWNLTMFVMAALFNGRTDRVAMLLKCNSEVDVLIVCVLAFNIWFIVGLCFICIDYYNECVGKLHIKRISYPQRKGLTKIDWNKVNIAIHLTINNSFISVIAISLIFIPLMKIRGICDYNNIYNYNVFIAVCKIPVLLLLGDAVFYFVHISFHKVNWLYVNIHKIHHQFIDTYAITANACHPVEHILANLCGAFVPAIILNVPLYWIAIWVWVATLNGSLSHSGYAAPIYIKRLGGTPHDFHHHFQNVSYGAGGYMDKLFKTRLKDFYPDKYSQMSI